MPTPDRPGSFEEIGGDSRGAQDSWPLSLPRTSSHNQSPPRGRARPMVSALPAVLRPRDGSAARHHSPGWNLEVAHSPQHHKESRESDARMG